MWLPPSKQQRDGLEKTWLEWKTDTMCHGVGKKKPRWSHPTNISHQFNTMRGLETWGQTGKPVVCINLAPGRFLSNCSTVKRWVTTHVCVTKSFKATHTHLIKTNSADRKRWQHFVWNQLLFFCIHIQHYCHFMAMHDYKVKSVSVALLLSQRIYVAAGFLYWGILLTTPGEPVPTCSNAHMKYFREPSLFKILWWGCLWRFIPTMH